MTEVLALVHEQMAELAAVQKSQAQLSARATAADGLVEVTVNAHGHVVDTTIDEAYLDEFEFDELAGHITEAAQAAVRSAASTVADMMAPIAERRRALPSLSDFFEGAPDLRSFTPPGVESSVVAAPPAHPDDNDGEGNLMFPTVRR
ncbi:Conserved DNA-binding protein YbaB [Mycolicibacterium rutilum]|uniref:Conserved DNA-binding protein YbaB n=2 Tax=Mycolicibacterium rutilum TaxID=370526 RepID=A0A1H6LAN2_MYCRU|nr:Conserved DNA-binding protein YbaB [Mycolicibacterium rutilum]